MSKAPSLRVHDVRDALRLVGDCRDLGGDPALWQRRALEGVCRRVGGFAATGGEGIWVRPRMPPQVVTSCDIGFEGTARDRFLAYMRANAPSYGSLPDVLSLHPTVLRSQRCDGCGHT